MANISTFKQNAEKYLELYYKNHTQEDKQKAIDFYKKAADEGDTDSLIDLGHIDSYEWFFKAHEQGNEKGTYMVAKKYLNDGHMKEALNLFERAASLGNEDSINWLGTHYKNNKEYKKALPLFYKIGNNVEIKEILSIFKNNSISIDLNEDCCICFDKLSSSAIVVMSCEHSIHLKCSERMVSRNCPVCRNPF